MTLQIKNQLDFKTQVENSLEKSFDQSKPVSGSKKSSQYLKELGGCGGLTGGTGGCGCGCG